jgi:hypothetical protein
MKPSMTRSILLLMLLGWSSANAAPGKVNVLLVGNSLSYVNNLPALFNGLAAQQPGVGAIRADLIAAPGGSIAERWQDGFAAREIASGRWQVLVLQERGGLLACLAKPQQRNEPECAASVGAHKKFARLAEEHRMRVILLGTWGPDAIWQGQLSRGLRQLAEATRAKPLDTGPLVRAYAKANPRTPMYTDAILHPALDASLLMAADLYRMISEHVPQAASFEINVPLLPGLARVDAGKLLSAQTQLAGDGTVTRVDAVRMQPLIAALATDKERHRHE